MRIFIVLFMVLTCSFMVYLRPEYKEVCTKVNSKYTEPDGFKSLTYYLLLDNRREFSTTRTEYYNWKIGDEICYSQEQYTSWYERINEKFTPIK